MNLTYLGIICGTITGLAFIAGLVIGYHHAMSTANKHLAEVADILGLGDRIEDKLK